MLKMCLSSAFWKRFTPELPKYLIFMSLFFSQKATLNFHTDIVCFDEKVKWPQMRKALPRMKFLGFFFCLVFFFCLLYSSHILLFFFYVYPKPNFQNNFVILPSNWKIHCFSSKQEQSSCLAVYEAAALLTWTAKRQLLIGKADTCRTVPAGEEGVDLSSSWENQFHGLRGLWSCSYKRSALEIGPARKGIHFGKIEMLGFVKACGRLI